MLRVLVIAVIGCFATMVRAEDKVVVATGADNAGRRTLTGTIADYNGKELKIDQTAGQALTVPAARVISVESEWNEQHAAGDRLVSERKHAEALAAYRQAMSAERRLWARRRIMAAVVTTYESLGQYDRAGDAFAQLMQADEHYQYLERAPLAWSSGLAAGGLEQRAASWLASETAPTKLLGASWSLSTPQRAAAVEALRELSNSTDPRVAHIADAQLWRANIATVGPQELTAWQLQIDRMPAELRAGPYLVLAKGYLQQDARMTAPTDALRRRAAWTYLKPVILYPERPSLVAEGLRGASEALSRLEWDEEAGLIKRELDALSADAAK